MSLFTLENVGFFTLTVEFPESKKDYVKKIISDIPIGKLKTEGIKDRDDRIDKLYDAIPRYVLRGENISIELYSNKFEIDLGTPYPPDDFPFLSTKSDFTLNKDFLTTISMDANYLLGIIMSLIGESYTNCKLSIRMNLMKENSVSVSFSKIINEAEIKEISDYSFVTGIVINNIEDNNKWNYYIRYVDRKLYVNIISEFNTSGTLDIYEIVENHLIILNNILLHI